MMTDKTPVNNETYSLPSGKTFNIELCELIPRQNRWNNDCIVPANPFFFFSSHLAKVC